jgi:RNA polymerase sigma factor (sigma-70 family)
VRGGRDEFADFYRANWYPCFRAVLASGERVERAEDLLSEAFAKAWASWPQLRGHPAPGAWVVRTALNTRVSWWRRRRREFPLADHDLALPENFAYLTDTDLLAAIGRLPVRQRQIIAMRILADFDTETTSQQLGIAPGTVRAHLSRAVNALRRELLPSDEKKEPQCSNATR